MTGVNAIAPVIQTSVNFSVFNLQFLRADITLVHVMLELCRITKVKVLFLFLDYVFNFNLIEFSAATLEKGLLSEFHVSDPFWIRSERKRLRKFKVSKGNGPVTSILRPSPFFSPFRVVVRPTQILGIFQKKKRSTTFLSHFYVAQEFRWLIVFPTLS